MSDTEVRMASRSFRMPDDLWAATLERANESDERASDVLRAALSEYLGVGCNSCGGTCDLCGEEILDLANTPIEDTTEPAGTATIYGYGRFSTTTNPEVQAVIDRAKELLMEGAVGVSVATDLNPDDMPLNPEDVTEDDIANAHQRVRHVAIVDTPAFSGAYLDLAADGMSVEGPMVFEGIPTGDIRSIGPVGTFIIEEGRIPIIFDIHDGDHTGVTVGYIERMERVEGVGTGDTAPLVASSSAYPAYLFAQPEPGPMTVSEPDAHGYRRYSGTIAPSNVCHKGMGGCYTYKGASLDYFHSGARIPTDDGQMLRVGPLMFGDMHADGTELDYATALTRTNEDARTVAAMGRVYAHPQGALFSGVLMPDADVMRIQACAPSVELWPDHRGKLELKTALLVPRPAFPVAASIGAGVQLAEAEPTEVEEPDHSPLEDRLARLESIVGELYATHLTQTLTDDE